jgi:acetyl-CoA C-acetyltransferase
VSSAVIVGARRTAVTAAGRALARVEVAALAAPVLSRLVADLPGLHVDDVVLGNCRGPGGNVARVAALAAGLGVGVPGVSVDRQCGSGLEAVRVAANAVAAGAADVVLAGGAESASTGPGTRAAFAPPGMPDPEMGEAAEAVARRFAVSRQRQDAYAVRSHARALAALAGADGASVEAPIVAVDGVSTDDRPRRLDEATLARFRPAFVPDGSVTAGNSCGVSDGAAALAVVHEDERARRGLPGLRVLASSVVGVDPSLPGVGPVPAVQDALRRAGCALDDLAVIEINEAFAAQVLACTDLLGLDPFGADADRICPGGGAIAWGHPWGASGALLVVRLFARLVTDRSARAGDLGLATCAIGGGQGIALVVERVG